MRRHRRGILSRRRNPSRRCALVESVRCEALGVGEACGRKELACRNGGSDAEYDYGQRGETHDFCDGVVLWNESLGFSFRKSAWFEISK